MAKDKPERTKPVRILVVDDHPAVRDALAVLIAGEVDLEVSGEAADLTEAVQLAAATHPDVAIIDLALKSGSGMDLIKRFRQNHHNTQIIVWSMHSDELYAERAIRAGARGYINKQQATRKIIEAIRHVLEGKLYLSPAMADKLLQRSLGTSNRASSHSAIESLSDRELDVFQFIGQGMKTSEIAARLHLSIRTIETYRDRIRAKLGLRHGTDLSRRAVAWVLKNG
jgi:DNA-binding NarL/FixJ family response regulator